MKIHKYCSVIGFCLSSLTSTYFCTSSSGSTTKAAPLNINKVSSSLLSFGRKLIAPAVSVSSSGVLPINSEIHSSSSSSSSTSPASAPAPALPHPLAESSSQSQGHTQSQHYRLLKSESMPVHLSKGEQWDTQRDPDSFRAQTTITTNVCIFVDCYVSGGLSACTVVCVDVCQHRLWLSCLLDVVSGGVSQVSLPTQIHTDTQGNCYHGYRLCDPSPNNLFCPRLHHCHFISAH